MVAAVAAAASLACRPHPGLGTVTYVRGATQHVLDLATCSGTTRPAPHQGSQTPPGLSVRIRRHANSGRQSIVFEGRIVLTVRESYATVPAGVPGPIMLFGVSPDRRWIFYAIDPQGSASLAADGLTLRVLPAAGGPSHTVESGLLHDDYRTWCDGRLVVTAGGDRISTRNKQLVVSAPPRWKPTALVNAPARAWGSMACTPDGRSIVVQSQAASDDANFFHTRWALWRVGLDGSQRRLTSPPHGYADESPQFAGAVLYFVRSRKGVGALYAIRQGQLLGPLVSFGYSLGYYGHHDWPYSVRP